MAESPDQQSLANKYGGNVNVSEGIGVFGPNPEEKIIENNNIRTFYKRYEDGTITVQVYTKTSHAGGTNIDIGKEYIDNTVNWDSL